MNDMLLTIPALLNGLGITIVLALAALLIGFVLAVILTYWHSAGDFLSRKFAACCLFLVCGTPLLVQLFLIYYGLAQFEFIRHSFLWIVLRGPTACAIIALAINTACYTTVLFTGAIATLPKNETLACDALGLSSWKAFRYVIFPRVFRLVLPAYSNEVVIILKSTSLASTITLLDLMGVTQQFIADSYQTLQWYVVAALIYLVLNMGIMKLFGLLYRYSKTP